MSIVAYPLGQDANVKYAELARIRKQNTSWMMRAVPILRTAHKGGPAQPPDWLSDFPDCVDPDAMAAAGLLYPARVAELRKFHIDTAPFDQLIRELSMEWFEQIGAWDQRLGALRYADCPAEIVNDALTCICRLYAGEFADDLNPNLHEWARYDIARDAARGSCDETRAKQQRLVQRHARRVSERALADYVKEYLRKKEGIPVGGIPPSRPGTTRGVPIIVDDEKERDEKIRKLRAMMASMGLTVGDLVE